jgi:hypothetical protein
MKAIGAGNTIAIEYDVTDHVRRGEILRGFPDWLRRADLLRLER